MLDLDDNKLPLPFQKHLDWPSCAAVGVFALFLLLARPFGQYPLNDDWQYAWVAKQFAKTGVFRVDVSVAPSLFIQSLFVYPLIKLFGFSHLMLRGVTWVLSATLIFILGRILRLCKVSPRERFFALLVLVCNPLFFNLANSFMTEIYGITLAFVSVLIWMEGRNYADLNHEKAVVSWKVAVTAALLGASTFWVRQTCCLIFPSIVAASVFSGRGLDHRARIKASLGRVALSATLFSVVVLFYFPWSKLHSVAKPEFMQPLSFATQIDVHGRAVIRGWAVLFFYLTAFLWPFLFASRKESLLKKRYLPLQVFLALFSLVGVAFACHDSSQLDWVGAWIQPHFPFLSNVISNGALGTLTLPDVYDAAATHVMARPSWGDPTGWAITVFLFLLIPLWAGFLISGRDSLHADKKLQLSREILFFAFFLTFSMTVSLIQAYRDQIFDRYHFPSFVVLLLAASVLASARGLLKEYPRRFALALLPLAYFTVAGTHDYFRWNDARWQIVTDVALDGIPATQIDGGYELNGWTEKISQETHTPKKYRIVMNPTPGYKTIAVYPVSSWLAQMPPLLFTVGPTFR